MNAGSPSQAREVCGKPHIGLTAHVVQGNELRIARIALDRSALIFVDRGVKTVVAGNGEKFVAAPGQALVLRGDQSVDFINAIAPGGTYEARWLLFDNALLLDEGYRRDCAALRRTTRRRAPARVIRKSGAAFQAAFEAAREVLSPDGGVPDAIARLRVLEVLYWLFEHGIALEPQAAQSGIAAQIRNLVSGEVEAEWPSAFVSERLAMSQATLRRRLSAEGTSLTEVIADVRMAAALTMLQATTRPVADIALAVGYESPSRFSVRFRKRFGFSPSVVRSGSRAHQSL
ncbi:helix-turn-helix transcriptional regulator [Herbaspirillum robiniae]|uniref:AraC family transcriptional regulator n=1 Tax=Herbaspirillum robiniae TaxID=2014887 RepID=A0A246WPD2_9BURK|nr:helix-turn-helix transcriptional regulator [Herbaspirillum robiniae]OWY28206.1 AraC family transcriptional regulator [Herbaspirillum robiniae]